MEKQHSHSYSQLYNIRWALETELNRMKTFEDRQEVFRVINYFENRIAELKEEEKRCLKIQAS